MFLLKYILFHAMKQIANVCYFTIMAAWLPPLQLKLYQYVYEKNPFYLCICFYSVITFAKQRCILEELMLKKKIDNKT